MRGNLNWPTTAAFRVRSIPARAGEPLPGCWRQYQSTVYPRACGGTVIVFEMKVFKDGLSPRVRGNPSQYQKPHQTSRSIPARAGEPQTGPERIQRRTVYPRACGGTPSTSFAGSSWPGLSPRVRGNPAGVHRLRRADRSIPARAGEPATLWWRMQPNRVYPRACGGTWFSPRRVALPCGLSPRVRGNLHRLVRHVIRFRSIPARAGEPAPCSATSGGASVYPRACGGTDTYANAVNGIAGLSPRVRGNPAG